MAETEATVIVFQGVEVQVPASVSFHYDGEGNLVLDFGKGFAGKLHLKQSEPNCSNSQKWFKIVLARREEQGSCRDDIICVFAGARITSSQGLVPLKSPIHEPQMPLLGNCSQELLLPSAAADAAARIESAMIVPNSEMADLPASLEESSEPAAIPEPVAIPEPAGAPHDPLAVEPPNIIAESPIPDSAPHDDSIPSSESQKENASPFVEEKTVNPQRSLEKRKAEGILRQEFCG